MAFQIDPRAEAHSHNISLPGVQERNAVARAHIARQAERTERSEQNKRTEEPKLEQDEAEISAIIQELETTTSNLHRKLKYSINKDLNRVVVKIIDSETDKVIKELPPEELQRMSVRIREAIGLLIDEEI